MTTGAEITEDTALVAPPEAATTRVARAEAGTRSRGRPPSRWLAATGALAGYLGLSVVLWWHAWSTHPASVTSCGCGDASLFLWYLEWPAYALTHGHSLFYSSALFHPSGTNLLSNTSVLAIGVPLVPVTLLFGPVATLNVASTLGPALTAFAMFWLLRRWVRWAPAAFVGGLVYGFSPFAFVNLAGAHLMLAVLVFLPLIVGCLDELLVRQRRGPLVIGGALGLLVVAQFFLSTEVLAIILISALVGIGLLVVYGAVRDSHDLARRTPHALRGLGAAATVSLVLLAYPLWFVFAGPAHLSGRIWPTLPPGAGAAHLANMWSIGFQTALARGMQTFGGYEGPALPQPEYLGIGMLVVLGVGTLVWLRDRRLQFFAALGLLATFLSLGLAVPWYVFERLPELENVVPGRFAAVTTLCAAVLLGVIVERSRSSTARFVRSRGAGRGGTRAISALKVLVAPLVALIVALVAVVPVASALSSNVPLTTRRVTLPKWFADVGPRVARGEVVLAYPAPFTLVQSAMAWQAVGSLQFAMAGGGGPGAVYARAGRELAGQKVISEVSYSFLAPPPVTPAEVRAVRDALAGWRVTTIVVPDPSGLPVYDRGTDASTAIALFSAAVGRKPYFERDAWVWSDVRSPGPPIFLPAAAFTRCAAKGLTDNPGRAVPDCIFATSRRTS